MYVCNCNGLSGRDVREAVSGEARGVSCVFKKFDCKPQCGRCVPEIREMLAEKRNDRRAA